MNRLIIVIAAASAVPLGVACGGSPRPGSPATGATPGAAATAEAPTESERLDAFFEQVFQRKLARSPMLQSYHGLKTDYGAWDDISDARAIDDHALAKADLERLASFDVDRLDAQSRLSYQLFEYETRRALESFRWRKHSYPVNQMHGWHARGPALLINFHRVDSVADAEAYVARLRAVPALMSQLEDALRERQRLGVMPPAFVFPRVLEDCRNLLRGRPFDDSDADSTLLADLRGKLASVEGIDEPAAAALLGSAEAALREAVAPAYASLIALLEQQAAVATTEDGAWKLPDGAAYYGFRLREATTTDLTARAIHELGLREVVRIHAEMRAIMAQVDFEGSLQAFFAFMRDDPRFYLGNDEAGRAVYLARAEALVAGVTARLDEVFVTKPKAALLVKPVEAFRQRSAGKAFYSGPAPDGSRPGIFYANLYDMKDMPTYQLPALVYHEAIPGHHMQIAIASELEGLPKFRRFGGYTAYNEGWGLYAELVAKELGLYQDPYDDFGRLAMELWRACRLVVDTGIHELEWTREQAIAYLTNNTPNPEDDAIKAIERYIVVPGQATAYTVGMIEILRLRDGARERLGDAFDLREFHEVVLTHGPVPLAVLADLIDAWVARKLG